jgi:hypothetical protein
MVAAGRTVMARPPGEEGGRPAGDRPARMILAPSAEYRITAGAPGLNGDQYGFPQ